MRSVTHQRREMKKKNISADEYANNEIQWNTMGYEADISGWISNIKSRYHKYLNGKELTFPANLDRPSAHDDQPASQVVSSRRKSWPASVVFIVAHQMPRQLAVRPSMVMVGRDSAVINNWPKWPHRERSLSMPSPSFTVSHSVLWRRMKKSGLLKLAKPSINLPWRLDWTPSVRHLRRNYSPFSWAMEHQKSARQQSMLPDVISTIPRVEMLSWRSLNKFNIIRQDYTFQVSCKYFLHLYSSLWHAMPNHWPCSLVNIYPSCLGLLGNPNGPATQFRGWSFQN